MTVTTTSYSVMSMLSGAKKKEPPAQDQRFVDLIKGKSPKQVNWVAFTNDKI